jgi:pheromone alpha factor receptor
MEGKQAGMVREFDYFNQPFTLLLQDGTPFNVTLFDVDDYRTYGVRLCVNYGTQIGASAMLLVVLLMLTKKEKRRSLIFALNALSLVFNTIRSVLQCFYFTGEFYHPYAQFAEDYSRVPRSQYANSIGGVVFTLLLLICVEISLVLQVRVVCVTLKDVHRMCILVSSVIVALVAVGFRFALTVINSRSIMAAENFSHWQWLPSANQITTTISICFFCLIFVIKLACAVLQRRKLGLQQFGPMQIIFIMGCQTLIVPGKSSMCNTYSLPI